MISWRDVQASMTGNAVLYHNPRCTKSRATKALLERLGVEHDTVLYLKDPPSLPRLRKIARMLEGGAGSLLRDKEARNAGWDPERDATDDETLRFIAAHPETMQRPVFVRGERAVIGRPPEEIKRLL